jgi:ATP-dependent Clp protease ATP-binding subunit ClpA/ActR/RegA family two-component response regulator
MNEENINTSESPEGSNDLVTLLSKRVVGQAAAMRFIVPYVYMWQAGLAPEGRPAGVFLLLGPTGTGKTKTVEAIAEVLHGSAKNILKIDCGEFQMEHEVAKLIGSPPGYLGHRETPPMLSQSQLSEVVSADCELSLVLFDEIEKAAPSLTRLLLGILDKAILRLGDNTTVNFEKTLIFFTSNLGAREMMKELRPDFGFQAAVQKEHRDLTGRLESIALAAVRKRFSPEFVNRIDAVVTYQPLDANSLATILDQHLDELQRHVNTRLGARCFSVEVPPESREFLLKRGTSEEYGARELKRTLHRLVTQPLATLVAGDLIEPGAKVRFDLNEAGDRLVLQNTKTGTVSGRQAPTVLIVDDNHQLLQFLERLLAGAGWTLLTAESAQRARVLFRGHKPAAVLLDYLLGDGDGVELGIEFQIAAPGTQVIIMTGGQISGDEEAICRERDIPVLRKPFLGDDVLSLVRGRLFRESAASRGAS